MRHDTAQLLFSRNDLRSWLEARRLQAVKEVRSVPPEEALARPPEQVAEEVIERHEILEPTLHLDQMTAKVDDQQVDVSGDFLRFIPDNSRPYHVEGSRVRYDVPYEGPAELLRLKPSRYSLNPPRAIIGHGRIGVFRDVPADTLVRDREGIKKGLENEIDKLEEHLGWAAKDVRAYNTRLRNDITREAEARRNKVLADRDTEAMLGVPLTRDGSAARSYRVQPVTRKRVAPRPVKHEAFAPEPAISDDDFAAIIGDIANITQSFERLAVTYADMHEERLRDQILTMLGNVYGPASAESFSKRGKTDIYLPFEGKGAVFLGECKWWGGPKAFAEDDLPQLLDRYVVWRDTHAAMILFIRNKDATAVIDKAIAIIREHERYIRDDGTIGDAPGFVLHKDGDADREIKLALITAVIHR